ncbi:MAG: hypothetical protein L3J37_10015 [Rhodobacteraceae bacterium]|nr:hypothetical protein [Paracoccaceae bacterium]
MNNTALIVAGIIVAVIIVVLLVPQTRFLLLGLPTERLQGYILKPQSRTQENMDPKTVEAMLLAAGLSAEPLLGDTGVSGHMARLQAGEVTPETLAEYADGLVALSKTTSALGYPIPVPFWDVDTDQLLRDGWTSYRIVAALNTPRGAPYVTALGTAYTRFYSFKTQPEGGSDTALDTALDLFQPVIALMETKALSEQIEQSPYIKNREQAVLYFWQDLVAGTSRRNPLTQQKLFDHGFATRFHMGTIWQYETGKAQENADIWGVSGFAPEFVGPPENNNQVEHMSISLVVQALLGEPLSILAAFEKMEQWTGMADASEAAADMALNAAINKVFIPAYEKDTLLAIEALRDYLRDD